MARNDYLLAIEQFDMEGYIEEQVGSILSRIDYGIELRTYCPFCASYDPDRKGKFYVNTETKQVFCQRCNYGRGVTLVQFIMDLEGITRKEAIDRLISSVTHSYGTMSELVDKLMGDEEEEEPSVFVGGVREIDLPEGSVLLFRKTSGVMARKTESYLIGRKLSKKQRRTHKFYFCGRGGCKNRLVVPVYFDGKLVHWVARDLTGQSAKKYTTPFGNTQSQWLYNWDNVQNEDRIVIVEGVFDVFGVERAGYAAVAGFGKRLSERQAELLSQFSEAIIMYDPDATSAAYVAASELDVPVVKIATLEDKDPGKATRQEIQEAVESAPIADSPDGFAQLIRRSIA